MKSSDLAITQALKSQDLQIGTRRLLVKWTVMRLKQKDGRLGLTYALVYNISEAMPIAKQRLDKLKISKTKVVQEYLLDLAIIGKLGAKSDIEYLSAFFEDRRIAAREHLPQAGEEYDHTESFRVGIDAATEIRDAAYVMALLLAGKTRKDLDEAGFFFSKFRARELGGGEKSVGQRGRPDDPFNQEDIGFIHDADRIAAIVKTREWWHRF